MLFSLARNIYVTLCITTVLFFVRKMLPIIYNPQNNLSARSQRAANKQLLEATNALKELEIAHARELEEERKANERALALMQQEMEAQNMSSAIDYINSKNSQNGSVATKNFRGIKEASNMFSIPESTLRRNFLKSREEEQAAPETTITPEEIVPDCDRLFINLVDDCAIHDRKPYPIWFQNRQFLNNYGKKKFAQAVARRKQNPPGPYFPKMGRGDAIPEDLIVARDHLQKRYVTSNGNSIPLLQVEIAIQDPLCERFQS